MEPLPVEQEPDPQAAAAVAAAVVAATDFLVQAEDDDQDDDHHHHQEVHHLEVADRRQVHHHLLNRPVEPRDFRNDLYDPVVDLPVEAMAAIMDGDDFHHPPEEAGGAPGVPANDWGFFPF